MPQLNPLVSSFARRFIFLYVVLYIFPYGFEYLYGFDTNRISFWTGITQWFGETFLGFTFNPDNLLKGFDSKYDYSRFILCIFISLMLSVIWVIVDSRLNKDYEERLHVLLRTIVRYHVGLTLIIYGLAKVFPLQFGDVGIDRLEMQLGQLNPMGFLWTFMGYSKFWTFCSGAVETIAGILLLFRRTTFLGAFIAFIAMLNVVLMDIGYDVSVKMFAIHLLLMTIILLSDDMRRLVQFFVFNKATQPNSYPGLFKGKKPRLAANTIKILALAYFSVTTVIDIQNRLTKEHDHRNEAISMLHNVTEFVVNGDTLAPLAISNVRWKNFSVNGNSYNPDGLLIRYMNDMRLACTFSSDTVKRVLTFSPDSDSTDQYVFHYERLQEKNGFLFKGIHGRDSLVVETQAKRVTDYPLTRFPIRWVRDL